VSLRLFPRPETTIPVKPANIPQIADSNDGLTHIKEEPWADYTLQAINWLIRTIHPLLRQGHQATDRNGNRILKSGRRVPAIATDGVAALPLKSEPDLILMDLNMPDVSWC